MWKRFLNKGTRGRRKFGPRNREGLCAQRCCGSCTQQGAGSSWGLQDSLQKVAVLTETEPPHVMGWCLGSDWLWGCRQPSPKALCRHELSKAETPDPPKCWKSKGQESKCDQIFRQLGLDILPVKRFGLHKGEKSR